MFGHSYDVVITAIKRNGYIVEIPSGTGNTALLPATEVDEVRVNPLKYKYKIGDKIDVKYYGKNPSTGKFIISRKIKSLKKTHKSAESSEEILNTENFKAATSAHNDEVASSPQSSVSESSPEQDQGNEVWIAIAAVNAWHSS